MLLTLVSVAVTVILNSGHELGISLYVVSTLALPHRSSTLGPAAGELLDRQAGASMSDDVYQLAKGKEANVEVTVQASPSAFHNELHNATILLMRHAEKPDDPDNNDLSSAGFARAKALADYIPAHFGRTPDYLFASTDSKHSSRPRETLEPLSQKIGVPIDTSIDDKDYKDLARELDDPKYNGKFIVVAWHHGKIPQLADKLGAPQGSYPAPWNSNVFDEILEFDYGADGKPAVKEITENIKVPGSAGH